MKQERPTMVWSMERAMRAKNKVATNLAMVIATIKPLLSLSEPQKAKAQLEEENFRWGVWLYECNGSVENIYRSRSVCKVWWGRKLLGVLIHMGYNVVSFVMKWHLCMHIYQTVVTNINLMPWAYIMDAGRCPYPAGCFSIFFLSSWYG